MDSVYVIKILTLKAPIKTADDIYKYFLARLDEIQKSLCTTPGVGVHIYVKVFSMAYIFQIT